MAVPLDYSIQPEPGVKATASHGFDIRSSWLRRTEKLYCLTHVGGDWQFRSDNLIGSSGQEW